MSVSGQFKSGRSLHRAMLSAAVLACGLWAGVGAQAAPVLSVNAGGPCPTQVSPGWTVAWLVPPQTALDPAEAITVFVREVLARVGWITAPAAVQLGCAAGGHAHAEASDFLVDSEDLGLDELLLSHWATRRAGPVGDEAGLWGRLGRAAAIANFGNTGGT